jgi:hypothetical protein
MSLSRNERAAMYNVPLLASMTAVLYQNTTGSWKLTQPAWFRLTMYALVNPANIIRMLPIATHMVNLCGCILFLFSIATVFIRYN